MSPALSLSARLDLSRPRRLLSLDGGGIRGVLAAEILVRIEETLRARIPEVTCLADYFDFVGGTSTGSILAAGVAMGLPATTLRDFYLERGAKIFRKTFFSRFWHRYDPKPLAAELGAIFGDRPLGSADLKTLLLVVTKNITTADTWFFSNNPRGKYAAVDGRRRLIDLIRASSSAPTYFPPVPLEVAPGVTHEFVDGGMSMFNNPSLQLFLEATHPRFGLGWPRGADRILLVSVGTGYSAPVIAPGEGAKTTLIGWAGHAINVLMEDANVQQNLLLRTISRRRASRFLDEELDAQGGIAPDEGVNAASAATRSGTGALSLLTYHRYTTSLTTRRLHDDLGLPKSIEPASLSPLDAVERVKDLAEVGKAVAREQVSEGDFEGFW